MNQLLVEGGLSTQVHFFFNLADSLLNWQIASNEGLDLFNQTCHTTKFLIVGCA